MIAGRGRQKKSTDDAVTAFDHVLRARYRGAGGLFPLAQPEPRVVALVALILGAAPRLGDMLERAAAADGRVVIDPRSVFWRERPDQRERIVPASRGDTGGRPILRGIPRSIAAFGPGKERLFLIGTSLLSVRCGLLLAGRHCVFADVA